MANVGFDFGTTHSSGFYWDEDEGFKSFISSHEGNQSQPTIVSNIGDWKYEISDEIAKDYFTEMLQKILSNVHDKKIEKLVAAIPERWYDTSNIYSMLEEVKREITKDESSINIIEIVSETELACAYYAWKYRKNMLEAYKENPDFNGFMLLIDYGGEALDISFCEVKQTEDECEISVRARNDEINDDSNRNLLGHAGRKFIHCVIDKITKDQETKNIDMSRLENLLEEALMSKKEDIDRKFNRAESELHTKKWIDLQNIPITYGDLVDVFEKEIKQVLHKALNDIDAKIPDMKDNFKIALTGGFCNFFLTKQAIYKYYSITNPVEDPLTEDMGMNKSEIRHAAAYGAALVAEGKIRIRKTTPYTLGIQDDENYERWLAFKHGEDMQSYKPYWVYKENDDEKKVCVFRVSDIPLICYDCDGSGHYINEVPQDEFKTVFRPLDDPMQTFYKIGFSMGGNKKIKLHFQEMIEDTSKHTFKKKTGVKEIVSKPITLLHNKYEGEE